MKQANHLAFGNDQDPARGHRRRRGQTNRLTGKGAFPEEVARAQYSYDRHRRLVAGVVSDGVEEPARVSAQRASRGVTLRNKRGTAPVAAAHPRADRMERATNTT